MNLPSDEAMRLMAKIAVERATEDLAAMADKFSAELPADVSGPDALRAFSAAIRARNATFYPKGSAQ